ncbi:DUF1080 domain-containing protein, partial [bacterium]|nr:DUF1080 domain-containing protein [bacterium]
MDRILHQALTASPDDRIQTAAQFRALVQRLSLIGQPTRVQGGAHARRRHPEPKKSPLPMVLGGVGLLVVAVIAFFALRGVEPKPQVKHPPPEPEVVAPVRPRVPKKQSATPLRVRPKPSTPKPVEKKTVPVSRPPVAPPPDEAGWVSLFDGKSLDGWQKVSRFPVPKKYGPGTSGEATLDAAKQCIFLEPGNPISGIHCKTALPTTDYEVELEATSSDGKAPMFRVVFLVGGAHCTLLVTGGERSRVGLDIVDGKGMADNGTAADVDIDPAKWTRVRFRVTDSKVAVWMNDQQVIEQSREGHDLDRSPYYRHVENLGLCARGSRPAFRNIRFRRLGEAPAPPAPPGPPVKPAGVSVFHGAVSRLPDGRVELRYDWSDEAQLRDWQTGAPDKRRVMPGGVRIEGGPNQSRDVGTSAPFVGDIDVTMKCRVVETHGGEACPSITICGEPGRAYGISLTSERQYVWRGERRYENAIKTAKGPFAKGEDHTVRVSREADRIRAWIDGRLTHDVTDASYAKGPVNLGSWNVTALFGDVRIVGSLDPAWLAANPEAQKQIDAIIAARKDAVENDPAKLYAKGVAALKPLWQRRSYADALAKARTLGDPGLIEDAEALAAFWGAVRAGAAKLKPGDSIRIRGTQGRVTKVEADTIHAKAGPVELGMKLTQLDDAAFAALAGKGRALTSGRDLLALALLEVHAKTPDRTKAMAALARAAEAGVDVSRRKALLAPPKRTATPPRPKPNPKPQPIELHVAVRVDGVSELVLTPGAMHWEHKSWAKPGSGITVNGKPITLLWQGGSNT